MDKWLICTHHLFGWGGSELVAIELAEELLSRGLEVEMYSPFPLRSFMKQAIGSIAYRSAPEEVKPWEYDVVYNQHQTISRILAKAMPEKEYVHATPVVIYNHLSPFEPFEFPGPFVEAAVGDIILCNSAETMSKIASYGPAFQNCLLYSNPAPKRFAVITQRVDRPSLRKILFVSNHLPEELQESIALLERKHNVRTLHIGSGGDYRRIEPEDLIEYDAVVTIGKTAQYAFRGGVPVYCYDRFGGPGWLLPDNFSEAAATNFSGRSHPERRSGEQIADELVDGFLDAQEQCGSFDQPQFRLEEAVDGLIAVVSEKKQSTSKFAASVRDEGHAAVRRKILHEGELYTLVDQQFEGVYPAVREMRLGG